MYTTLFLDIGGVILTNGWDRHMREKAARKFHLDEEEMNQRHSLIFDTYEIGKISLNTYLNYIVFYVPRSFTHADFKTFMFHQSQPHLDMIQMIREFKHRHSLRIVTVSNEGRELMDHRIQQFQLKEFIDLFICSAYVGLRKPDEEIYRIALDIAQVSPQEVIYIDDRQMLTEVGKKLGMQTIQHRTLEQTRQELIEFLRS